MIYECVYMYASCMYVFVCTFAKKVLMLCVRLLVFRPRVCITFNYIYDVIVICIYAKHMNVVVVYEYMNV